MTSPTFEQAVGWCIALVGGGAGVKVLDIVSRRAAAARREPASMTRASADLMEALSDGGRELLDEFRKEFKFLRLRVAELQEEVDKAKALARSAQADHSACQAELAELRGQIDALMAGPVAGYKPRMPK